ncbi:GNAT family N-acetyltransferase [Nocardia sp. NPDC127526]|uniref:GNAT family N-acetyltransferase n=1 Tax=Nocardia sp. NPDC127526 TaxID=3345393 RepID=UPI00362DCDC1
MPDDDLVDELRIAIEATYPGVSLWIHTSGTHLILGRLVVPEQQRNQGIGTAIMQRLLAEADHWGIPAALTPSNAYGGSLTRLRPFYRRFGFKPNRGRNKDFHTTESMVRTPKSQGAQ